MTEQSDLSRARIPSSIDRRMLQSYLGDHLTGASGGRARARNIAKRYADTDMGADLSRLAEEIDEEHAHLSELMDSLGLRPVLAMRALARAGELAGRLKPNGRLLVSPPLTPLLEIELLRAAVNGKQGLWEVLREHSTALGLDPAAYGDRAANVETQRRLLERLHSRLRPHAFSPTG